MRVLLYTPSGDSEDARRLERVVVEIVQAESIESFKSLESFAKRLHDVLYEPVCSVLFAADNEEMLRIKELREILSCVQVLLVVPDQERETLAIAHLLHPRFLTGRDSDFSDLGAVLRRKLSAGEGRSRSLQ